MTSASLLQVKKESVWIICPIVLIGSRRFLTRFESWSSWRNWRVSCFCWEESFVLVLWQLIV